MIFSLVFVSRDFEVDFKVGRRRVHGQSHMGLIFYRIILAHVKMVK